MTAYTTYSNGATIAATSGGNAAGFPAQTVLVGEFDASKRNLAAGDTAAIVTIPKNTWVHQVFAEVLVADDATHVFNIGDDADPNGYVAGAAADALATVRGNGAFVDATAAGVGKLYTAANTIDIEANTADPLDTLKVRVYVVCTILGTG